MSDAAIRDALQQALERLRQVEEFRDGKRLRLPQCRAVISYGTVALGRDHWPGGRLAGQPAPVTATEAAEEAKYGADLETIKARRG
jgi:hypothetical protein